MFEAFHPKPLVLPSASLWLNILSIQKERILTKLSNPLPHCSEKPMDLDLNLGPSLNVVSIWQQWITAPRRHECVLSVQDIFLLGQTERESL